MFSAGCEAPPASRAMLGQWKLAPTTFETWDEYQVASESIRQMWSSMLDEMRFDLEVTADLLVLEHSLRGPTQTESYAYTITEEAGDKVVLQLGDDPRNRATVRVVGDLMLLTTVNAEKLPLRRK